MSSELKRYTYEYGILVNEDGTKARGYFHLVDASALARLEALEAENARQHREFMEAIDYAADIAGIEADTFIRVWREGGCEEQSDEHNEWGDFREWRAARRAREGGNTDG